MFSRDCKLNILLDRDASKYARCLKLSTDSEIRDLVLSHLRHIFIAILVTVENDMSV